VQFGHAGAIIEGKRGGAEQKRKVLRESGVFITENFDDIPSLLNKL
jgi:succinyl-CoA synthetase alpha subunit